jgi:hypothetical protein
MFDSPLQTPALERPEMAFCRTGKGGYVIRKTHWRVEKVPKDCPGPIAFIQRDPRDVAISAMFYRSLPPNEESLTGVIKTMVTGKPGVLPHVGLYFSWVNDWLQEPVIHVKYESLHLTPLMTLAHVHQVITGELPNTEHLKGVIHRQRFDAHKARDPHAMRKGVAGDWRNHFTRATGEYMDTYLGNFMMDQGYITTRDWWKALGT